MGIFEQFKKSNESLLDKIDFLSYEIKEIKAAVKDIRMHKNVPEEDTVVLRFSGEDTMNFAITAKALGLKQRELQVLTEKGLLSPCSARKRNFKAKDVYKYINSKKEFREEISPGKVRPKVKKEEKPKVIIGNKEIEMLKKLNNII